MVVAPTVAAVGLSFYSYGFPQIGACLEIGAVQILLVIIFSLVSFYKFLYVVVVVVFFLYHVKQLKCLILCLFAAFLYLFTLVTTFSCIFLPGYVGLTSSFASILCLTSSM